MSRFAFLLLLALSPLSLKADESMLKIVFRQEAPRATTNTYAAFPETIYRWTSTKGRVEQAVDHSTHIQHLFIVDGKDGWIIDEVSKTGKHLVDPSDSHHFYAPIVPQPDAHTPSPLRSFELGHELDFMRGQNVSPRAVVENGAKYSLYECIIQGYTLRFYLSSDTMLPAKSEVWQNSKMILRLVYLEYHSLPADPALFAPPTDVKISDARQD